jgi:hypothetical protein
MADKEDLLTPADLAHNRSGEATAAEKAEEARAQARVLEQSILAQTNVAQAFKDGTPEFRTAVQIVISLRNQYSEKVFNAATLRALALFGGNKQLAAQTLERWLDNVEEFARQNQEQQNNPGVPEAPGDIVDAQYEESDEEVKEGPPEKPDDEPVM